MSSRKMGQWWRACFYFKMIDISVYAHAKASKKSRKEKIGDVAERRDG